MNTGAADTEATARAQSGRREDCSSRPHTTSLTVFLHRGLSPHQFTPMSGAHDALQRTRPLRSGCNPCVPRAGSLALGRSAT